MEMVVNYGNAIIMGDVSLGRKQFALVNMVSIFYVKQKMFGASFEGCILSHCGLCDVVGSGYKYIHCNLSDPSNFMTITLTIGSTFFTTFSPQLNVGSFVQMSNFGGMFKNKFEWGDWMFVLKVGPMIIIDNIDPFPLVLNFVLTYTIEGFM